MMDKLPKEIYKRICVISDTKYYYKNIRFFELFLREIENNFENTKLVKIYAPGFFNDRIFDDIYYNLVKINSVSIPVPIFIGILFGKNYCSDWNNRKHLKRLGRVYAEMKAHFK